LKDRLASETAENRLGEGQKTKNPGFKGVKDKVRNKTRPIHEQESTAQSDKRKVRDQAAKPSASAKVSDIDPNSSKKHE
jgi:hypothetical protein